MEISVYPHTDEPGETVHIEFDKRNPDENPTKRLELIDGPLKEWAVYRTTKLGEVVCFEHLFIRHIDDEKHSVGWVKHGFVHPKNMVPLELHHVICDCTDVYQSEDAVDKLKNCEHLEEARNLRAREVNSRYGVGEYTFDYQVVHDKLANMRDSELAIIGIARILNLDYHKPSYWVANRVNGRHEKDMLAKILGQSTDKIDSALTFMHSKRLIAYDGEGASLLPAKDNPTTGFKII